MRENRTKSVQLSHYVRVCAREFRGQNVYLLCVWVNVWKLESWSERS